MSRPDRSPGATGFSVPSIPGARSETPPRAPADPSSAAGPHDRLTPLSALAARLRELPPSCGPVRLVAVDGHAGSGKTTFAGRLADCLGAAPVLHLDDLASHDAFFDWTGRLHEQVLAPLSQGRTAHYRAYDWTAAAFPSAAEASRALPPAPVVVIEGVGAGRRSLRPHLACLLWMDMEPQDAWSRGMQRDGEQLAEFWKAWMRSEKAHFTEDPSYSSANYLVRQGEQGFEVREGPAGSR